MHKTYFICPYKSEPIDNMVSDYAAAITETKTKFPDTKMVVAGLPPHRNAIETRTKIKDYNQSMKEWCRANNMNFGDNQGLRRLWFFYNDRSNPGCSPYPPC